LVAVLLVVLATPSAVRSTVSAMPSGRTPAKKPRGVVRQKSRGVVRRAQAVTADPNQARREWAQMSPEERRIRAEGVYRNTWEKAAHLYGQTPTEEPPALSWEKLEPGTYGEVTAENQVLLSPRLIRKLSKRPVNGRGPRRAAQERLLHEWAHVYQEPRVQEDPNENHREEAAQLFATYYGHKLFGGPLMADGQIPYYNRKASSRDLASVYGKGYWRRRQFGL